MVDMNLLIYTVVGALILALIALIGSNSSTIVSIVSGEWGRSIERARIQKERRERVYGYADVTSSGGSNGGYADASTGADDLVPRQQHQSALELVPSFEALKTYLTNHTLTDDEAIEMLALARRSSGDDLLSANKIRDIVGGNEGKVKAHVAAFRKPRPKAPHATRIDRPVSGWN